jgi:protein-tyrosine kinase
VNAQDRILPLDAAPRGSARPDRSIGAILVDEGRLSLEAAEQVLQLHREEGLRFGEAALKLGLIGPEDLRYALAKQFDFHYLPPDRNEVSVELVAAHDPFGREVEELRALRTQLLLRWFRGEPLQRTLAVVSPGRGEGRSFLAANLAIVFSQLGERTLLVDADLRHPDQGRLFRLPEDAGLSTYLSGRIDHVPSVPVPGLARLAVLPAGAVPPNPQEIFSRGNFGTLLEKLRNSYEIIVIDTSAASAYADARSIAAAACGALLLGRRNHTRLADARELAHSLASTGVPVVGAVVNDF